jgi:N-acetylmuramoyl-L-alanine amidase
MKAKLSSGTQGVASRVPEYQLNLDISLMLKTELEARGYNVIMIRTTNDCPMSNAERAVLANNSGADIFVRIHANGSTNSSVKGALCCAPTANNPYLTADNIAESRRLSQVVVDEFCKETGANNQGLYSVDTMTGINWCEIPVTIVEMGYMSNAEEDLLMTGNAEYRTKMVNGIANGIDKYFEK